MMILKEKFQTTMILQFMDLEKFFDKEAITDVLQEAHCNEVRDKTYRLLYHMNKKRLIKVDTPFGETKEEEVKEGMGQGGLDSSSGNSVFLTHFLQANVPHFLPGCL